MHDPSEAVRDLLSFFDPMIVFKDVLCLCRWKADDPGGKFEG